jgi:hypothetical protein
MAIEELSNPKKLKYAVKKTIKKIQLQSETCQNKRFIFLLLTPEFQISNLTNVIQFPKA